MSPRTRTPTLQLTGVPRASGDEPNQAQLLKRGLTCSPRERG